MDNHSITARANGGFSEKERGCLRSFVFFLLSFPILKDSYNNKKKCGLNTNIDGQQSNISFLKFKHFKIQRVK